MPIPQTQKTAQERAGELHAAGDLTAAAELLATALAESEKQRTVEPLGGGASLTRGNG